jgi:hypothetical protein
MIQMQLRVPYNQSIEDVVSLLSLTILESVKRELDSMEVPFESFHALEKKVVDALNPYVRAFDACGTDPVCTTGIHGKTAQSQEDRIYMLHLPTGLTPVLEGILNEALGTLRLSLDARTNESLNRRVFTAVQRELDRHTYWNPSCGKIGVCHTSQPIDPWDKDLI